ncbi:hypothetical protein NC653_010856 [Populus alba x Populus x berolinensis]|uniref:non-specific serine/threonine protein kinase n=1 Tax=Populus alba x Populus x berolinensis TaxID=444605 RepID=A0AAD6R238_9ROSI|nr:hypothetical protein NC653_010856 [Populus alba x Populus x berolinensis]
MDSNTCFDCCPYCSLFGHITVAWIIYLCRRKSKPFKPHSRLSNPLSMKDYKNSCTTPSMDKRGDRIASKEIEVVADGFADKNLVGSGNRGVVYRGVMLDATRVAVKRLLSNSYLAQADKSAGVMSEKSDVYSFGILVMEIICARVPVDHNQPQVQISYLQDASFTLLSVNKMPNLVKVILVHMRKKERKKD